MEGLNENQQAGIEELFARGICTDQFAHYLRRLNFETMKIVLRMDDDEYYKPWIYDGIYWSNELCEILDPQLEDPEEIKK